MTATGENKRRAALNRPGLYIIYPVPDGTIDEFDRMQAAGFYPLGAGSPVAAASAASEVVSAGGAIGGLFRSRAYPIITRDYREAEEELILMLL